MPRHEYSLLNPEKLRKLQKLPVQTLQRTSTSGPEALHLQDRRTLILVKPYQKRTGVIVEALDYPTCNDLRMYCGFVRNPPESAHP